MRLWRLVADDDVTTAAQNLDDVDPACESHIWDAQRYALAADRSPHMRSYRLP